jgi:hypothetical protein
MKIIAHRKELLALEIATDAFSKISLCKDLKSYENLIRESRNIYELLNLSKYSADEWKGYYARMG